MWLVVACLVLLPHVPGADPADAQVPSVTPARELSVERTVLVGGEEVVSGSVEQELRDQGFEVDRIAGDDRYETASSVALRYGGSAGVGSLDGDRTALLTTGEGFADALAAGPVAAHARFPLLLTPSDRPDASVDDALQRLSVERIVVVGGAEAVSADAVDRDEVSRLDFDATGEHLSRRGPRQARPGGGRRADTVPLAGRHVDAGHSGAERRHVVADTASPPGAAETAETAGASRASGQDGAASAVAAGQSRVTAVMDLSAADLVALSSAPHLHRQSCRGHIECSPPFVRTLTAAARRALLQAAAAGTGYVVVPADDEVESHARDVAPA